MLVFSNLNISVQLLGVGDPLVLNKAEVMTYELGWEPFGLLFRQICR